MLVIPTGYANVVLGVLGPNLTRMSVQLGVKLNGAALGDIVGDTATWAAGGGADAWNTQASDQYSIVSIEAYTETASVSAAAAIPGLATNDPLPPNVAAKVRKVTGLRGRANRGAIFWTGWAFESQTSGDGRVAAATANQFAAATQAWADAMETHGATPVVLHRGATPPTPTPIILFAGNERLATQRRRLSGR